ncbi:hypothetical protein MRX96_011719 [Rhipicephalus microplus]
MHHSLWLLSRRRTLQHRSDVTAREEKSIGCPSLMNYSGDSGNVETAIGELRGDAGELESMWRKGKKNCERLKRRRRASPLSAFTRNSVHGSGRRKRNIDPHLAPQGQQESPEARTLRGPPIYFGFAWPPDSALLRSSIVTARTPGAL